MKTKIHFCIIGRKIVNILLKLKIIYNLDYFESYLRRLSLAQEGDRWTVFCLKLHQANFAVCIIRLLVYRQYQDKVSSEVNALFYNVFAIENLPANVNLAIVFFLLNGMYFQKLLYFSNNGITSNVTRIIFQKPDNTVVELKQSKTKNKLLKLIKTDNKVFDYNDNKFKLLFNQDIKFFKIFIVAMKNAFQMLFIFMSK